MGKRVKEFLKFLQEEEKAKLQFMHYLKFKGKSKEIRERIEYLQTLIRKARDRLPVESVMSLKDAISTIKGEIGRLKTKLDEMNKSIGEHFSEWRQSLKNYESLIQEMKAQLSKIIDNPTQKKLQKLKKSEEKLAGAIKEIEQFVDIVQNWIKNEEIELLDAARKELKEVKELMERLKTFRPPRSVPIQKVDEAWRVIGRTATNEQGQKIGFLSDVFLSLNNFTPMVEIKREKQIPTGQLRNLFSEIKKTYGKSDFHAFRESLIREIEEKTPPLAYKGMTPTNIKLALEEKNLQLESISDYLKPEFKIIGYIPYTEIAKGRGNEIPEEKIKKDPALMKAPSTFRASNRLIGREKQIGKYVYTIKFQSFLPKLGFSFLLLRKGENGVPIPSQNMIQKILAGIREKEEILKKFGVQIKEELSDPDKAAWRLRLAVINGLEEKEIGEGQALRAKYLFPFCLQFGIPVLFTELLQSYFYVIKSPKIQLDEESIVLRPLNEELDSKILSKLLPKGCEEIFGYLPTEGQLKVRCTAQQTSETLEKIAESKVGPEKAPKVASKATSNRRLLQVLIFLRRIRHRSDYEEVLVKLGKEDIDFSKVEKKLKENAQERLYMRAMRRFAKKRLKK